MLIDLRYFVESTVLNWNREQDMYLKRMATNLFMERIGNLNDYSATEAALSEQLFGGRYHFDLHSLLKQFSEAGSDLAKKSSSWLDDGKNQPIFPDEIQQALGQDTIKNLSSTLEVGPTEIKWALSFMVPKLIDTASRGGSLFYRESANRKDNSSGLFEAVSRLLR